MHDLTLAGQYADRLALLVVGGRRVRRRVGVTAAEIDGTRQRGSPSTTGPKVVRVVVHANGSVTTPHRAIGAQDERLKRAYARSAADAPVTARRRSVVICEHGRWQGGNRPAAFGTMLRAVARGWKVSVVQFVKSSEKWKVGEREVGTKLGVDWSAVGDGFSLGLEGSREER